MQIKDYTQLLTDKDKVHVVFTKHRNKILKFVVQYYSLTGSRWRTIMRIDNCHGFPHRHVYHSYRKEYKTSLTQDNNSAFTESKGYIIKNYRKIKENYIFSK